MAKELTKIALEKLKPGLKRRVISDGHSLFFTLSRAANGAGTGAIGSAAKPAI
jgi:hypothetical protein